MCAHRAFSLVCLVFLSGFSHKEVFTAVMLAFQCLINITEHYQEPDYWLQGLFSSSTCQAVDR